MYLYKLQEVISVSWIAYHQIDSTLTSSTASRYVHTPVLYFIYIPSTVIALYILLYQLCCTEIDLVTIPYESQQHEQPNLITVWIYYWCCFIHLLYFIHVDCYPLLMLLTIICNHYFQPIMWVHYLLTNHIIVIMADNNNCTSAVWIPKPVHHTISACTGFYFAVCCFVFVSLPLLYVQFFMFFILINH